MGPRSASRPGRPLISKNTYSWHDPGVLMELGILLAIMAVTIAGICGWSRLRGNVSRRRSEAQACTVFDEYEPRGTPTDFFPGKGPPPSEYLL